MVRAFRYYRDVFTPWLLTIILHEELGLNWGIIKADTWVHDAHNTATSLAFMLLKTVPGCRILVDFAQIVSSPGLLMHLLTYHSLLPYFCLQRLCAAGDGKREKHVCRRRRRSVRLSRSDASSSSLFYRHSMHPGDSIKCGGRLHDPEPLLFQI